MLSSNIYIIIPFSFIFFEFHRISLKYTFYNTAESISGIHYQV